MMSARVQAKELQALFCNAVFFSQAEGPFVETYLKVFGPSAEYAKTASGTYQASLKVTLLFKIGDKIIDFRKYNLLSAELEDTLNGQPNFIDQQRISLPYGIYQLDVSLADNNTKESPIEKTCTVALEFDKAKLKFSDFQFVDSFTATEQDNILSKSGFDLVPYVGDFYPPSVDMLNFYTELYNVDKIIGEGQNFLFRYYIESSKDTVVLDDFNKFQRKKSATVNPLLVTISISDLPNGDYNLVVEAVDRNNEVLAKNKTGFQRINPGLQLDESDIKAIDITSTFAEKITSLDSLKFYLQSLNPIATMRQNQFVDKVLRTNDIKQMQKFLFGFWKTRNDQYPEAEWNTYKAQVLAIEESYRTKIKHGYETDMGYTWLKYGTPDQVEDSKHEPNAVPYIIWQYFHIENQSNVRFVFNNPHLVGTEYFLIYSDARDNRYNTGWSRDLYDRTSSFGSGGGWGSRFSSNFRR
jgi:GWxTD domain-containing protein